MITSQKLFVSLIMISFLIGLSSELYHNPKYFNTQSITQLDNETNQWNDFAENLRDTDEQGGEHNDQEFQITAINTWQVGSLLFGGIKRTLWPWSITPTDNDSLTEQLIRKILQLFQSLLILIVGFELYFIFFNKKNT